MPLLGEYKEITEERRDEMIEYLVNKIAKYNLFVPAIFFLETGQPLSFVFSQLMYGGAPFSEAFVKDGQHRLEDYAQVFEDRKNLNLLIDALSERAQEAKREEEKAKLRRKRAKEKMKEERKANPRKFKLPWSK